MQDRFKREINYLRISLTDKCNLRCRYCVTDNAIPEKSDSEILTIPQIVDVVKACAAKGVTKIRLTGGEPLLRKDLISLIKTIRKINGISEIALTTNATILAPIASDLVNAGLTSINISLDTLNPEKYRYITRNGNINDVMQGIKEIQQYRIPVKINTVVIKGFNDDELLDIKDFCESHEFKHQTIKAYELHIHKKTTCDYDRPPKCRDCNRIRLLSKGTFKPCLHSNIEIPVDFNNISASIDATIDLKPEMGTVCDTKSIIEIGG